MNELTLLMASAGASEKLYSNDVFSPYLYTGTGAAQTITNGIDLAGKGGLVWCKMRVAPATSHGLFDTSRGVNLILKSDSTAASVSSANSVTAFSSTGFSLGTNAGTNVNASGYSYVSWTFRKALKFFDIVTYTGNGASNRSIAHSLGVAPGVIISKATSTTGNWNTYHRSASGDMVLNTTAVPTGSRAIINSADSSTFTVSGVANTNAVTYVAYLFAHDTSTDGIIQCGTYTGNGSFDGPTVTLGWEPQYVMVKNTSATSNWVIFDTARGFSSYLFGGVTTDKYLRANTNEVEGVGSYIDPLADGFRPMLSDVDVNDSGNVYVYMAIRRPNKPPKIGASVYKSIARTGTGSATTITGVGFAPDFLITKGRAGSRSNYVWDRYRGFDRYLITDLLDAEVSSASSVTLNQDGAQISNGDGWNAASVNYVNHFLKRAPGFFDIVCYNGTNTNRTQVHNLNAIPEMIWVKKRDTSAAWAIYYGDATKSMQFNTGIPTTDSAAWNNTVPTSSVFSLGTSPDVNTASSSSYVAYLFATLKGVSKVGSYTGNGSTKTIDCGFTTGARFVMVKATSTTGDWLVADTTRGIISANDPRLSLNTTAAEVTTEDWLDPDSSGFVVNQVAGSSANASGVSYIFLAIA